MNPLEFMDSDYVKYIPDEFNFFLQKKYYSPNYHDDWSSRGSEETITGVTSDLDQLREQVFIYVKLDDKHVYSNIDSVSRIWAILYEELKIDIPISLRLVSIEDFESKISALTSISIKVQSVSQKAIFLDDVLNFDNGMIDLSDIEEFKLDMNYGLTSKKKGVSKMYKQLVKKFNIGDLVFKGSNEDNLFQFNSKSMIHKIPIKLAKNGKGKIYDYKEVYSLLRGII